MDFNQHFQSRFPFLKPEDFDTFYKITTAVTYKKGGKIIVIKENKRKAAIILKGLVRGYLIDYRGKDTTAFLLHESQTVASYRPILLNKPSNLTFECLEKTSLLVYDFSELESLSETNPRIRKVMNAIMRDSLLMAIRRSELFITQSPEKRYLSFIEKQGHLLQRVSQKHIASYLGITPVSFSRLKKRVYMQQE